MSILEELKDQYFNLRLQQHELHNTQQSIHDLYKNELRKYLIETGALNKIKWTAMINNFGDPVIEYLSDCPEQLYVLREIGATVKLSEGIEVSFYGYYGEARISIKFETIEAAEKFVKENNLSVEKFEYLVELYAIRKREEEIKEML